MMYAHVGLEDVNVMEKVKLSLSLPLTQSNKFHLTTFLPAQHFRYQRQLWSPCCLCADPGRPFGPGHA